MLNPLIYSFDESRSRPFQFMHIKWKFWRLKPNWFCDLWNRIFDLVEINLIHFDCDCFNINSINKQTDITRNEVHKFEMTKYEKRKWTIWEKNFVCLQLCAVYISYLAIVNFPCHNNCIESLKNGPRFFFEVADR